MPLPSPVSAVAVERWHGDLGSAAAASMQGVRSHFEDSYHFSTKMQSCGVYDGHLGDDASSFAAARLPLHVEAMGSTPSRSSLQSAFAACDVEMEQNLPAESESGTTATFAKVLKSPEGAFRILVASAGDSRAVLWRKSSDSIESTVDHRPNEAGERARIEAAGGTVNEDFDPPRIDGQLACSRALGAFKFKQDKSRPPEAQKVSAEPVIYEWQAQVGDFLILACDGVFDVFSNDRVVKEVCKSEGDADLGRRLESLLNLCLEKEADDNMTILAIELGQVPAVNHEPGTPAVSVSGGNFLREKDKDVLAHYDSFCRRFGWAPSKEIVPKAPPKLALTEVAPTPAPDRFSHLPPPKAGESAAAPLETAVDLEPVASLGDASVEVEPMNGEGSMPMMGRKLSKCHVRELRPLVVVGPSGVGKGTLIKELMDRFPERFGFSVSHTTRAARPGEVDGVHYHFTNVEAMQRDIADEKFIEHAKVHGNLYGTSEVAVEAVQREGKICILDIDIQGAKQVKERGFECYHLGIIAPTVQEMEARLRGRGTETEEKIQVRLKNSVGELEYIQAPGSVDRILRNGDKYEAVQELCRTIREWFPILIRSMRVTAKRSVEFYSKVAKDFLEGPTSSKWQQVEVVGVGDGISNAGMVIAAMVSRGHKVCSAQTSYGPVASTSSQKRKGSQPQAAQLRVLLLRGTSPASSQD